MKDIIIDQICYSSLSEEELKKHHKEEWENAKGHFEDLELRESRSYISDIASCRKVLMKMLNIPNTRRVDRELKSLAYEFNIDAKKLEIFLDYFVKHNLINKKIEYCCETCYDSFILDNKTLNEFLNEDGVFECENCMRIINIEKSKTGYIYYDIMNKHKIEELFD